MRLILLITVVSAIIIAFTAALFSVTGISSVFSGHFIQVAIMASSLEIGKLVVASILYRYWLIMNKFMKTYMLFALFILMIITSAGIFGYLSEAYQKTKGGYDIISTEIQLLENKRNLFKEEYTRYENRIGSLTESKSNQEKRLNDLYSKDLLGTARRIEDNIKRQDAEISKLNERLMAISDSISYIESQIVERKSKVISGDIGPLQYVANAFNTDIDTVVKFFILILIFVFDPLAVVLVISANMLVVNKHYERKEWVDIFSKNKFNSDQKDTLYNNTPQGESKEEQLSDLQSNNSTTTEYKKNSKKNRPWYVWKSSNWVD